MLSLLGRAGPPFLVGVLVQLSTRNSIGEDPLLVLVYTLEDELNLTFTSENDAWLVTVCERKLKDVPYDTAYMSDTISTINIHYFQPNHLFDITRSVIYVVLYRAVK